MTPSVYATPTFLDMADRRAKRERCWCEIGVSVGSGDAGLFGVGCVDCVKLGFCGVQMCVLAEDDGVGE